MHRCENEQRLCYGNGDLDNQAQDLASAWHSGCDGHISFTPTTPAISSITVTNDAAKVCTTFAAQCASASAAIGRCKTDYSSSSAQSSCFCAPQLQAMEYSCAYLGNVTCLKTSATLSNLPAYGYCSNFQEVIGELVNVSTLIILFFRKKSLTLPQATATTTASASPLLTTSLSGSVTVARPTVSSTASATASSTSSGGSPTIGSVFQYQLALSFFMLCMYTYTLN
jgi:hypothetical protein